MKKWKVITGIVIIFLLGALAGSAATGIFFKRNVEQVLRGGSKAASELVAKRLSKALKLDAAQRSQLDQIVDEARKEMIDVRRQIRPQIRDILNRAQDKVNVMLTPDQREKFQKIIAKRRLRDIE